MATPAEAVLECTLESALETGGERADAERPLEDAGDLRHADVFGELDRRLVALCREGGPLRAVLAGMASRLVSLRAWERIGYARLSDYAVECLGLSARSLRSLAHVGARLGACPRLQDALVSGELGWAKVRLLAGLPRDKELGRWIAYARRVTAEELSKAVRNVDRGSVEAGAAEEPGERSRLFEVRCRPEVRWKWNVARGAAARAAGRILHVSEAAELIAAEVLSALPIDEDAKDGPCEEAGVSWSRDTEPAGDLAGSRLCGTGPLSGERATTSQRAVRPPWRRTGAGKGAGHSPPTSEPPRPALPASLRPLIEGLEEADAFALDARFRRALSLEQRLEARIGPLLAHVWGRYLHRALGYATREAYARERLGMDPTRARALVRLERAAVLSESFARAYRKGALSWVKAGVLAPLVSADPLGGFVGDWVAWAGRVTVRRLREDVDDALATAEADPEAFRRSGGLPPEAGEDREIGAPAIEREGHTTGVHLGFRATERERPEHRAGHDREIGAPAMERAGTDDSWHHRHPEPPKSAPDEVCWARFIGPPDVVQLFRAVLCTVRRRMAPNQGRLPTAGDALGVMLDHVLSSWGALDARIAARHKIFSRDGWRCAVPGCTSMQNLHDHHIRFRSAGGEDTLENRITLCAFHHLRGVHAGLLRCVGRAPDGLRWELGIRPGVTPLLAYRSGDVRIPAIVP